MLPFRRSRNGFRVRAGRFGLVLGGAVLALAGAPASAEDAPTLPAEFLPAEDPAWRDLEDLWNLGGLTDLPLFTRPLPRGDVAAALERTLRARPDLASRPSAVRLRRELAFERAALGEPATEATSPLIELREDDALVRIRGEIRAAWSVDEDRGELAPGSIAAATVRVYPGDRTFARAELGIENIVDSDPLGDSIVKNTDAYLSVRDAYVSFRTAAADIRLGLGTNRWGPGDTGTLLLSDAAFPYPEIAWARTFGQRFRFVSTTAALHLPEQRWFSGHRIEVAFGSRLRVGIAECAAYRSSAPDLLYVMGLIPYTLVQRLHDRTSTPGTPVTPHRNNIAIAGDFAWRPGHGLRLDGQLLIDDFATESASQPDRIGWLAGLGWSGWVAGGATSARAEMAKVYRWTYAVFYDANLIQDGVPLGYGDGPDVERGRVAVDRDLSPDLRVGVGVDWRRRGASPVGEFWDPDTAETRSAGATLTDPVERRVFPHVRVESLWRDALRSVVRVGALDLQNAANVTGADRRGFAADVSLRARW